MLEVALEAARLHMALRPRRSGSAKLAVHVPPIVCMRPAYAFASLALVLLLSGCSSLQVERRVSLDGGQLAEVNLVLQQGQTVGWVAASTSAGPTWRSGMAPTRCSGRTARTTAWTSNTPLLVGAAYIPCTPPNQSRRAARAPATGS